MPYLQFVLPTLESSCPTTPTTHSGSIVSTSYDSNALVVPNFVPPRDICISCLNEIESDCGLLASIEPPTMFSLSSDETSLHCIAMALNRSRSKLKKRLQ